MFQGRIGKIAPQTPERLGNFVVLALFSICPSLNSGLPTPIKIIFLEPWRIGLSLRKVWLS